MTFVDGVTVAALILGPVAAVLVSIWVQNRKEKRQNQLAIFTALLTTSKFNPLAPENIQAMNMIDIVFHDKSTVRRVRRELFELFADPKLGNPPGVEKREKKRQELIYEIAKVVGYSEEVSLLDFERIYFPEGLAIQAIRSDQILNELLRVLKSSGSIPLNPKKES